MIPSQEGPPPSTIPRVVNPERYLGSAQIGGLYLAGIAQDFLVFSKVALQKKLHVLLYRRRGKNWNKNEQGVAKDPFQIRAYPAGRRN